MNFKDESRFKQVIIVRTDIKMSKGKLAVQVAHASVEAVLKALEVKPSWVSTWRSEGGKKVVLRCNSEVELLKYAEEGMKLGLPVAIIRDAGLTELPPGTLTAVAIGPGPSDVIDKITGKLKLL